MSSVHEASARRTDRLVVFDLRDAEAWEQAGRARTAWGRNHSEIHALDNDHVAIVFWGAEELEAAS